jgi:hypothetical protein
MQARLLKIFLMLVVSCLIFFGFLCWGKSDDSLLTLFPIQNYDQKLTDWIKPTDPIYDDLLLGAEQQKIFTEELYRHYFSSDADALSPWNPAYIKKILSMLAPLDIFSLENKIINFYDNRNQTEKDKIGYASNFRPYTEGWIEAIKKNLNISQFNQTMMYSPTRRGIAVDNLYARMLPTEDVYFYNAKLAGQGYPFDNLQGSVLWAGSPVYVLGETLDQGWFLVLTPDYYIAWVKSAGIAWVNNQFVKKWQGNARHPLVAVIHTKVPILDIENNIHRFSGYVGMIFPLDQKEKHGLRFLIPVADAKKKAHIHHALLSDKEAALVPIPPTIHHFNEMMNQLIHRPYGWGGMYFYNDCSSELKNLYAAFGIWLPRHSTFQVDPEKVPGISIDLSTPRDATQRINALEKNGHRFMTIVYVGGHILMYLGSYPNPSDSLHPRVVLTYQNMWGLSPRPANRRAVVGGAVLLPLMPSYPEDRQLISHADHQIFRLMNLNEMQEIQEFRKLAFDKIDMHALMWSL